MNRKKFSKKKKAAGGITLLQQPKTERAASQTTQGQSTQRDADEQVQRKVKSAMQQLFDVYWENVEYTENVSDNHKIEESIRKSYYRKIYRLGQSKRFLYLLDDEWFLVTWEGVKKDYIRRFGKESAALAARICTDTWAMVCQAFGQIIWNEGIKELHGKAVIA